MSKELPEFYTNNVELITSTLDIVSISFMSIGVLYFLSWLFTTPFHKKKVVKDYICFVHMINSFNAFIMLVSVIVDFEFRTLGFMCVYFSFTLVFSLLAVYISIIYVIKSIHKMKITIEEKRNNHET